jgi:hypothetical protein
MYLSKNQRTTLMDYFILRFSITCFGFSFSPSSRGYVFNVANGDCLLKCRLSVSQDGAEAPSWPIDSLTCFGLSYSPSSRGYVFSVANGDCLLKCPLSLDHGQPYMFRSLIQPIIKRLLVQCGKW